MIELMGYVIIGTLFLSIFIVTVWVTESFWTAVAIWTISIIGIAILSFGAFLIELGKKGIY